MTQETPHHTPNLLSDRLLYRAWRADDASEIARQLNDFDIAKMTGSVPHPYPPYSADGWISSLRGKRLRDESYNFAIVERTSEALAGSIGIFKRGASVDWELGYWIGRDFWGKGYASEAAQAVMNWTTGELGAEVVHAGHFADNPASGRILEKVGFRRISNETVPMYSLARGERAPGYRYVWPAEKAEEIANSPLH